MGGSRDKPGRMQEYDTRIDNGGEYTSTEFQDFLKEKGIRHETTVPHSPQQNGVAERMNRTLQEAALSMTLHAGLSKAFCAEAVCNAAYVRNRVITTATKEPETLKDALDSEYATQWKAAAADAEYQSLLENETWELVELPAGRKPISCKWVFKVKHDQTGKVERFKGRLVAKGFLQKYGIDYDETFSPVVRFSSIRDLLAFGVSRQMLIHQMDVVTAFLNGTLDEEIYMQQPEGYVEPGKEGLVCRLKKSLYGLKQSPRCWNNVFKEFMLSLGFVQSVADPCVFIRVLKDKLTIVTVHVDDLILVTDSEKEMIDLKTSLANHFKMKDMGVLHYCLGVSVTIKDGVLQISQEQYIGKIMRKYKLQDCKTVSTPMDLNVKLVKDDGYSKPVGVVQYQSMVGSLIYAAIATRPDISYAVAALAKFKSSPTEAYLTAVKRVFWYLKGTDQLRLQYQETDVNVEGYSDADWASDSDDRRSTSGNVFVMLGGAISLTSKKQPTVALSTSESEYIALCLQPKKQHGCDN